MRLFLLCTFLSGSLAACAATQPSPVIPLNISKRPPDPKALKHYIDAKILEMKGQSAAAARALRAAIAIDSTSATLYKALCRNLMTLQRHDEAVGPSRKAVALDPKDLESRWIHQNALLKGARDTASAVEQLRAIAQLDSNPLPAYHALLQIYSAQNRSADALRVLARMETLQTPDDPARLVYADQYVRHDRPDLARPIYEKILSEDARRTDVWGRYSDLVLASGDTIGAANVLRKGLTHNQHRVDQRTGPLWGQLLTLYLSEAAFQDLLSSAGQDDHFLETLTNVYVASAARFSNPQRSSHQYDRAEILLDRLIGANPDRHDLLAKKAELLLMTNRPQDARAAFQRAVEQKGRADYAFGVGRSYLAEQEWDRAIQALLPLFNEAQDRPGLYSGVAYALGRAYAASGRIPDARAVYERAVGAFPKQPGFRFELARTFGYERSWKKAIPIFEDLVQETEGDPELFPRVLFELGRHYERAGQFEASVETFQRLLTLNPENHLALNYLGYMLADKGIRLKEAQRLIERALGADPDNGAYLDSMGWVFFQQGQHKRAMEFLQRAVDIEERSLQGDEDVGAREDLAVIHDHTGDAARALGDHDRALRHWLRALEFDPENEEIRRKLQRATDRVCGTPVE